MIETLIEIIFLLRKMTDVTHWLMLHIDWCSHCLKVLKNMIRLFVTYLPEVFFLCKGIGTPIFFWTVTAAGWMKLLVGENKIHNKFLKQNTNRNRRQNEALNENWNLNKILNLHTFLWRKDSTRYTVQKARATICFLS